MKVFVSATTQDLGECRVAALDVLWKGDIHPVIRENLPPDHRELPEFLHTLIAECEAVVCLVGAAFGTFPSGRKHPLRSYTQLEYDYAQQLGKPVFVFMTSEVFASASAHNEPSDRQRWQREHRVALMNTHKCEVFSSVEEFKLRLALAVPRILTAAGRVPLYYLHLPPPPLYFVGRAEEMQQLRGALHKRFPSLIAVIGIGGQGKTTLVHQVLRERLNLPFSAGFWCTAYRGGFSFEMFLDEALGYLTGGKFEKRDKPQIDARIRQLLEMLQQRPILVVLDGLERWLRGWSAGQDVLAAEAEMERGGFYEGLDEFLRQASGLSNGSHIIFTSRALPAVLDGVETALVPIRDPKDRDIGLEGLAPDAAVALLRSLGVEGETAELMKAAQTFACHPLALKVLAGFVAEHLDGQISKLPRVSAMEPKGAMFELLKEIQEKLPGQETARRFLEVASHSLDNPPLNAVTAAMQTSPGSTSLGANGLRKLVATLSKWQLVVFDRPRGILKIHPLVKEYFLSLTSAQESRAINNRLSAWYASQPLPENVFTLEQVKPRLLAIEHALRAGNSIQCAVLLFSALTPMHCFGEWLAAFGHFDRGIGLVQNAADISEGITRAELLIARAALCSPFGRVAEAVRDLDEAIGLLETRSDRRSEQDWVTLAGAFSNRGNAHLQIAEYDKAAQDFDRAVNLLSQSVPNTTSSALHLANALVNRATLHRELGDLTSAIRDCSSASEIHRSRLAPLLQTIDPELASALTNRGNVYCDLHDYESALKDYGSAHDIYSNLLRIGQLEFRSPLAQVRILRGVAQHNQGHYSEAMSEFNEAVSVFQELVNAGKSHLEPVLAFGQMNRAKSLTCLGDLQNAQRESKAAREKFTRLVNTGRVDLFGSFVHSLLLDSVVLYQAGDKLGSRQYRTVALEIAHPLIERGEHDVLALVVRFLFETALILLRDDPAESVRLLTDAVAMADEALRAPGPAEGLLADLRFALEKFEPASLAFAAAGLDLNLIHRLKSLVTDRGSP